MSTPKITTEQSPNGYSLAHYQWAAETATPKGVIVLAHGYGEHAMRYQYVAASLAREGYRVHALDHHGHGASHNGHRGYFSNFRHLVHDLDLAIRAAHQAGQTLPLYLLGHSMGGLLSLYCTIEYAPPLTGLMVSAPFVPTRHDVSPVQEFIVRLLARLVPRMGAVPPVGTAVLSRDESVQRAYAQDPLVYHGSVPARVALEIVTAGDFVRANLSRIRIPTLVMHGSADTLANPNYGRTVHAGLGSPDKQFKLYDGLRHEILNEPERDQILADMLAWLAAHGA